MSEPLERNQVIELLDKLGSEQDEDVLAAARMLHSQIIESGMGWEDLLVGDEPEGEEYFLRCVWPMGRDDDGVLLLNLNFSKKAAVADKPA